MAKYLDDNGLSYLWQKIKAHVNTAIAAIGKVPTGGTAGQILAKASGTDYDTEWITNSGGSGNYLPITGGTLTGQLEIPDWAVADASQTPSANQYGSALYVTDQQGVQVGYLGLVHETDDDLWMQIGVTRDVNGSPAYNSLWLGLDDDGTPTVYLGGSDGRNAWCKALGYTDTSSVSGVFTKESSVTIRWFRCTKWGNVVSASMSWYTSKAISVPANGNITDFLIGTFAAGYRPPGPGEAHGVSSGDGAGAAWYYIGSSGQLQLGACEGTGSARTIAANTAFDFHATWVV